MCYLEITSKDLVMFYFGIFLFLLSHILIWLSICFQFIKFHEDSFWLTVSPFWLMVVLAIPTSLCTYYANKICYEALGDSAWSLKFFASGTSYIIFPMMTWFLLEESIFTPKILVSLFLSAIIIWIQVKW